MLASVRHSRVGQRDCDVFSNKQQIAALLWNEKLNISPQIVRRLLQHSASDSLSHHHSKGSRCSVACSPFRFAIFHVHFYDSTQDATKTFLSITHYIFMGNHLKDKTTCWQLSVAIKMNFCVKVETNSVRDNADHGIEAAAAGCDKADS